MRERSLNAVALVSMLFLVGAVLLATTMPSKPEVAGELVTSVIGLSYNYHLFLASLFLLPGISFCSGLMVWDIFYHRVAIGKIQTGN